MSYYHQLCKWTWSIARQSKTNHSFCYPYYNCTTVFSWTKGISSPGGTQVQYAESVPYTMEFQCHVDKLNQNISGVSLSSHPIKIDISNPENFLISFSQQGLQLFKHKIQFSCIYVFPYRAIETNLDKLNYPFCRASEALSY